MKNKRYKRVKKAILAGASSGIVAGMLIMSAGNTALAETYSDKAPAYTQSTADSGMHMMRRWNTQSRAGAIALQLGLDPELVQSELKQGKTMKQILQENGLSPNDVHRIFENRKSMHKRMWKNAGKLYLEP